MNSTLYLNQSFIEMLLANGKSAQDLLVAIVRTSIDKDERFEPCPERIAKQSELVKFCISKGASLKGAFKNAYEIPATFIENNLPLVIASQYDPTQILERISGMVYGLTNRLSLITKLVNDYKADVHILSSVSDLDSGSIEFLLSKGMKVEILLRHAFNSNDKKEQKALFDLALKHGAGASSFKGLHTSVENCHKDIWEILIKKYKVPAQDLLNVLVHARINQYNQVTKVFEPSSELIAKQSSLINFLIGNGANLKDIVDFSSDFVKNNPSLAQEAKEARYLSLTNFVPKDMEIDPVVLNLIKGVFVKKSYPEKYTNEIFLEFCYGLHKVIQASPTIARVLNYVSQMPNLAIYVDDEGVPDSSDGVYKVRNGLIYIKHSITDKVVTIVHECFHKAFDTLYRNHMRPYSSNDRETREQLSKLIESDLLVQELVPKYKSWFTIKKYSVYKKEHYDVELFTFLVDKLTNKILENTTHELEIGTREFTKESWEILQKIVATMPVKGGTIYTPEPAPESLMLSEVNNDFIQKLFILNPNLDSSAIDFLLNIGMKVEVLFRVAFESENTQKQKELFELAFKHGASTTTFKDLNIPVEYCNEDILQILMDQYKVPVQDLLNVVLCAHSKKYNQVTKQFELSEELLAKQKGLTHFLITKGAHIEGMSGISSDFLEYLRQLDQINKNNELSTGKVDAEKELSMPAEGVPVPSEPSKYIDEAQMSGSNSPFEGTIE